jgi:hypothetical protein
MKLNFVYCIFAGGGSIACMGRSKYIYSAILCTITTTSSRRSRLARVYDVSDAFMSSSVVTSVNSRVLVFFLRIPSLPALVSSFAGS